MFAWEERSPTSQDDGDDADGEHVDGVGSQERVQQRSASKLTPDLEERGAGMGLSDCTVESTIAVSDLNAARHFYGDQLGLTSDERISLWLYVTDCDEAVEQLRSGGAAITAKPQDQPWGERIARVLDPDGNELIIATAGS